LKNCPSSNKNGGPSTGTSTGTNRTYSITSTAVLVLFLFCTVLRSTLSVPFSVPALVLQNEIRKFFVPLQLSYQYRTSIPVAKCRRKIKYRYHVPVQVLVPLKKLKRRQECAKELTDSTFCTRKKRSSLCGIREAQYKNGIGHRSSLTDVNAHHYFLRKCNRKRLEQVLKFQ
jgi:hypothetical protein